VTQRPPVNVAQSVHQKLLTRAKSEGRPFNELLQHYAIERFCTASASLNMPRNCC
jgi:hypothetical protein